MKTRAEHMIIAGEVYRIAEELIHLSNQDEKGIYWITPATDKNSQPGESIDLFNGSAGIILFFLAMYKYRSDKRYLEVCIRATDRLLQHTQVQQPAYYTLYGGATGVLYVCIQLFKATGNEAYLRQALELSTNYRTGFDQRLTSHDLLSGQAGILLAVSHLYACSRDASLLPTIHNTLQKLVQGAHIAVKGLKWDVHKHTYDSLTGFSHGGSGIAFALLQTGHYFNAPGLLYLANEALLYETNYYDERTGNYFDLRVGVERMQTLRQQYGSELLHWPLSAFRPTMSGISSWAHGAAGCALTRLFAFELTGNKTYVEQALPALEYSWTYFTQQKQPDYSLCSGYGGIAMVFQQATRILKQPAWYKRAEQMALAAIGYYKEQNTYNSKLAHDVTDPGLFSGLAGVGYWMLGCLQPPTPDTILHPAIVDRRPTGSNIISDSYTTNAIQQSIHARHTEQQIVDLWKQHKGFLQYRQRRLLLQPCIERYMQLSEKDWLQLELVTTKHLLISDTEKEIYYCHENGIGLAGISPLTALLLQGFRQGQKVGSVMTAIQQKYFSHENRMGTLRPMLLQVKELVKAGFLVGA